MSAIKSKPAVIAYSSLTSSPSRSSHIPVLTLAIRSSVLHLSMHLLHQHTHPYFISLIYLLKFNAQFSQITKSTDTHSHIFLNSSEKDKAPQSWQLQAGWALCCHAAMPQHSVIVSYNLNLWETCEEQVIIRPCHDITSQLDLHSGVLLCSPEGVRMHGLRMRELKELRFRRGNWWWSHRNAEWLMLKPLLATA